MIKSTVSITRSEVVADNGVVAGGHELEAAVGVQIMQQGGNAIDAAVAAQFVANVVEPAMCGVSGHGFLAVYHAESGEATTIDWQTKLPRGVREDMFELEDGVAGVFGWRKVKSNLQSIGYLASETPATVQAMWATHQRYGRLPWKTLIEPAIHFADEGFPIDWRMSTIIASSQAELCLYPETARIFLKDGVPPRPGNFFTKGDTLVQKDLARTLRKIADEGIRAFTEGEIPAKLEADMKTHGGILTGQDMAECLPYVHQEPRYSYRDCTYISGGCPVLVEALNILECFDLASLGPDHPTYRHLMIEAMYRAWTDNLAHMGDPFFMRVPAQGIRSKGFARKRADSINLQRATGELAPGDPWEFEPGGRPPKASEPSLPSPRPGQGHTTQMCTMDNKGNMVTVHTSLGLGFGSKVTIPGTGIVLGNGIESFDPEPGKPNSLVPGKRPLLVVPVVLMWRNGKPFASVSGSGARRILAACLQIMVNLADFGMGMQQAVEHTRLHKELGDVFVDSRVEPAVLNALRAMGHPIVPVEENVVQSNFARPVGVLYDQKTGRLHGGADPMRAAGVAGF